MNRHIPYLDLQQLNASYEPQLSQALVRVASSGRYLQGSALASFEQQFANYCGVKHCVGVGNGLDALTLILLAYQTLGLLSEGDEVILPANTYIATALAVLRAGLKPVLCEPCATTSNIDVQRVPSLITDRTRVLLPVHLYGALADMESLCAIAHEHGLLLIEDAAQAHGSGVTRRAGAWGDAAAFSFYPAKNLGALGDGGAVVTNDSALAEAVRALGNYGSLAKYHHIYNKGVNSRLDDLQAAVLEVKLAYLDADNARRRYIANRYLQEVHWSDECSRPAVQQVTANHVFHVFALFTPHRDALQDFLNTYGIGTQIHYPIPLHKQPALSALYEGQSMPVTEQLAEEELSLPISPSLSDDDVSYIIDALNQWIATF